jgi:hypothetical protein
MLEAAILLGVLVLAGLASCGGGRDPAASAVDARDLVEALRPVPGQGILVNLWTTW